MSLSNRTEDSIDEEIAAEYKQAAYWLPFSGLEIKKIFNEKEIKTLEEFKLEIQTAGKDNQKQADAIKKYSDIAFKLLKMAKVFI